MTDDQIIARLRILQRSSNPALSRIAREAADALERRNAASSLFGQWAEQGDDPLSILPEVVAARCLGIQYGDPGPVLPPDICRSCYGDRYVWYGNAWGLKHLGPFPGCTCSCHEGEVWMAALSSPPSKGGKE